MSHLAKNVKNHKHNRRRVDIAIHVANAIKESVDIEEKSILDIGCGVGLLSHELKECKRLIGLDNSKKMLGEFASKFYDSSHFCAYFLDLNDPIPYRADLIVSSMTLHHIKNPQTLFNKLYHALSNSGMIFFADLAQEDGTFHAQQSEKVYHNGFEEEQLKEYLSNAGFQDVACEIVFVMAKGDREYPILLVSGVK
jgi:predicted TPR repeat methyltransferase